MTTEQTNKIDQIVDRLLIKTQDDLCNWKKVENCRYTIYISGVNLFLSYHIVVGGKDYIQLEVERDSVIILDHQVTLKNTDLNILRLYNAVVDYHNNYVNTWLEKITAELQKLNND